MSRYPEAEWVPWRYLSDSGQPTYFKGINRPEAVVLHVMQGYMSTARQWAIVGHYGASWHFSVGRDGSVMQHLDFEDGGYHAGIGPTRPNGQPTPEPTWALWKGWGPNVNTYTIGIEHEGFSGDGFTVEQQRASRDLCRWLAADLGVPYDRDHFPPHADIDLVNRANDFAPPDGREAHYQYMFEEESMTPEERAKLDAVYAALTGGVPGVIEKWNENGNSVLVAYTDLVFPHLNHGTNPAPEEPRVRTIRGTIEGTISE
jgi:hypothetical protein